MWWIACLATLMGACRYNFDDLADASGGVIGDASDGGGGGGDGGGAAAGMWTLVHVTGNTGFMSLTVPAVASGDVVVIAIQHGIADTVTGVMDNHGGALSAISGSLATDSGGDGLEMWSRRLTAADTGATVLTVADSLNDVNSLVVWEFSGLSGAIDMATAATNQTGMIVTTSTITTHVAGDAIVAATIVATNATPHLPSQFTNDSSANSNGWGHLTSNTAPIGMYQDVWDQNANASYCASAAAFVPLP